MAVILRRVSWCYISRQPWKLHGEACRKLLRIDENIFISVPVPPLPCGFGTSLYTSLSLPRSPLCLMELQINIGGFLFVYLLAGSHLKRSWHNFRISFLNATAKVQECFYLFHRSQIPLFVRKIQVSVQNCD